jgi:hypothetical protein
MLTVCAHVQSPESSLPYSGMGVKQVSNIFRTGNAQTCKSTENISEYSNTPVAQVDRATDF